MLNPTIRKAADVHFKVREELRLDAPRARADYEAAADAVREKTARLRALRLSRMSSTSRAR
jgi:hypothetical protein